MKKDQGYSKATLRTGYTTGVCAAAAAKAAVCMLLTQEIHKTAGIKVPRGDTLTLSLVDARFNAETASCAVQKDSGDDPDITNGILVYASVTKAGHGTITIDGGKGVGRVTKPGLACRVGEAAINPVPKEMIRSAVEEVCGQQGYTNGLDVVISIPAGEEIANKTFNSRLGILGGISILGTTGIVEPMSEKAWTDSLYLEMKQQKVLGNRNLLICPGNYGRQFIRDGLGMDIQKAVKCSNFIGEALDYALDLSFDSILLIGHVGKLVKLGAGIMNTHSKYADARMEVLALHAALCGLSREKLLTMMDCNTTEEGVSFLEREGIRDQVFQSIMEKIEVYVHKRTYHKLKTAVIVFSNDFGILGKTTDADDLLHYHQVHV